MRSKTSGKSSSKLMRIVTIPIKVLLKAKNNYVNSMNNFAAPTNYGSFMGLPGAVTRSSSVSTSSNVNYDNEDLRELVRSSSVSSATSSSSTTVDMYVMRQQLREMKPSSGSAMLKMGSRRVPRSCSVGMGKIEEDSAYDDDFGEEKQVVTSANKYSNLHSGTGTTQFMYSRSRSHAMPTNTTNLVF